MRKGTWIALALLLAFAAAACADELPGMKASLWYDGEDGISAHIYLKTEAPLYVVTDYFRYGGEPLPAIEGNAEGVWTRAGGETAVYLSSLGIPETDWPEFEMRLTFLAPEKGTREIVINSPTALSQTDAALAEGLTPVEAEAPHTVLVGSAWYRDHDLAELAEEDGPLYVPMIGEANSDADAAAELTGYCNLRVVGRRKLAFDFTEEETKNRPVSVPAWRVVPVSLSLPDGEVALPTAIEDEAGTAVTPEKAAEIASLALAGGYGLAAERFREMEGDVMLLHPPEGPEDVWVVNLMDSQTGEALDYAAQVDAATGEILWIAGPGEGNG